MALKFLKNTVGRLLALAAGIILACVCGYFLYEYLTREDGERVKFLPALLIGGTLLGVGLAYYGITGKTINVEEHPGRKKK
jgi:F0F1-type ATP synthase assembly protein I